MAKGLAVVSGSNDVVFKALETGVITLGSVKTDAVVEVSGALTLRSHTSSSGPTLSLYDLDVVGTGSAVNSTGILIISGSEVKQADHISSSYVLLADGRDVETAIYDISSSLNATVLTVKDDTGTGSGSVDLGSNSLIFSGTANETTVTIAPSDGSTADVTVTIGLPDDVTVTNSLTATTVTASSGLLVGGAGATITGDISGSGTLTIAGATDLNSTLAVASTVTVESGGAVITGSVFVDGSISGSSTLDIAGATNLNSTVEVDGLLTVNNSISASGDLDVLNATVHGNLEVVGNLTVQGDVTSISTTDLLVEDAIIMIGSGAVGDTDQLALVFGSTSQLALETDGGVFTLGTATPDNGDTLSGSALAVAADGTLHLGTLSASVLVEGLSASFGAGGLTVVGDTSLNGSITLGDASSDVITINGFITGSGSPIIVSSSLTIGDAGNVSNEVTTLVSQVRMPIFSVTGANAVAGFPAVPDAYWQSPGSYNGHMFYLTSSDGLTWTGDGNWAEGNKWYFNERGVWHESFFFNG